MNKIDFIHCSLFSVLLYLRGEMQRGVRQPTSARRQIRRRQTMSTNFSPLRRIIDQAIKATLLVYGGAVILQVLSQTAF
jgi:hypothetical protein